MSRKRTKRKFVQKGDGLSAIAYSSPFSQESATVLKSKILAAWAAMKDGTAKTDDFDLLAATVNVSTIRAETISHDCVELCLEAGKALMQIRDRFDRVGRFGVDADSLDVMPALVDFYCQLIDNSTPRQMADAVEVAFKRLNKGIFFKSA